MTIRCSANTLTQVIIQNSFQNSLETRAKLCPIFIKNSAKVLFNVHLNVCQIFSRYSENILSRFT